MYAGAVPPESLCNDGVAVRAYEGAAGQGVEEVEGVSVGGIEEGGPVAFLLQNQPREVRVLEVQWIEE